MDVEKTTPKDCGAFASAATCALVVAEETLQGYLVSRQAILQRVKRGEIQAIHVKQGRKKGLRLNVIRTQTDLFNQTS
jgi:hypothetical protein